MSKFLPPPDDPFDPEGPGGDPGGDPGDGGSPPVILNVEVDPPTVILSSSNTSEQVTLTMSVDGATSVIVEGTPALQQDAFTWIYFHTFNASDYAEGSYLEQLFITAENAAGNDISVATVEVIREADADTTAPTISSFTVNDSTVSLTTSSQTQTVTFTAVATDNVGITSYSVNNGASFSSKSGNNYYFTKTFNYSSYSWGTTTTVFTCTMSDAAGNTTTATKTVYITKTDNQAPSISSFTVNDSTVTLNNTNSTSQTVTFTANMTDNRGITSYSVNNGATFSYKSGTYYYFTKTFNYSNYSDGSTTTTFTLTASDAAGNTSTSTRNVTITRSTADITAPVISSITVADENPTLYASAGSISINVQVQASDSGGSGLSNVTVVSSLVGDLPMVYQYGSAWNFTLTYNYANYDPGHNLDELTVTAIDGAGNLAGDSTNVDLFVVDDVAPIISSLNRSTSTVYLTTTNQTATVTYTAVMSDNEGITSYSLSDATFVSKSGNTYTWTKTYSYSSYGWGNTTVTHTLTASDAAGNVSTSNISVTVNKSDNQAPSISSFTVNDSTVSLTTSSQSQTVTFTAVATDNRGITGYSVNNGASFSSKSGNNYYFTKTFSYADYSFGTTNTTFTFTATDAAGNSSTATRAVSITKTDNQAPTISSFSVTDSTITLTTSSQTQTVTFNATISDNVGISSASLPGTTAVDTSGSTRSWSKTFSYGDYSFGTTSQTFTLTVTDAAGNSSTSSQTVTITKTDNQAPTISSFTADDTTVTLTSSSQSQTVTYTGVVSDNVGVSSVAVSGLTYQGSSGSTYTWTKTFNYSDFSYGTTSYTRVLVATDAAGNTSTLNETVTVTKTDNQAPTISSFTANDTSVSLTTSSQTQTVTYTAVVTDNVSVYSVSVPGATYVGVSGNTYTWTKTFAYADYSFGSTNVSLTLTASDATGNTSTLSEVVTVTKTDTQSPTITSFGVNDSSVSLTTSSQSQTLTFTAVMSDNRTITSYSVTGATFVSKSGSTYTFTRTYSYADYSFGTTNQTVTLTASDAAGNTSTDSLTISVTKTDNQAPTISSFTVNDSTVTLTTASQSQTLTFNATISDNVGISSATVSPSVTAVDTSGSTRSWTKIFNYGNFSFGTTTQTYTLTVSDSAGNTSTASVNITITKTDTQQPSISSFSVNDSTISLTTSSQTQTVIFSADITDNVAVSSVSLPGATYFGVTGSTYSWTKTFSYGDYSFGDTSETYTVTATDAAGNTKSSSLNLTVTKLDNQVPTISSFTSNDDSVSLTTSSQTQTITLSANISDNRGVTSASINNSAVFSGESGGVYSWTATLDYSDFSFGTSTRTYTLTATDEAGNYATATKTITITKTDDQAPSIASFSASPSSVTLSTSSQTATVNYAATISDNVSIDSVILPGATLTSQSGTSYQWSRTFNYADFNWGSTNVASTLTVTDTTGNESTSGTSVTVTKVDNEAPSISSFSVSDSTITLTTTSQSQTITITAVATDNRGISAYSVPGATFSSLSGTTYTWTKTYNYADYNYGTTATTLTVTMTDAAGNATSESIGVSVTKSDNQAPSISSFTSSVSTVTLPTSSQTETVTFNATISDNVAVSSAALPGTTAVDTTGSTRSWQKTFDYADYSFGTTVVPYTLTVTDTAGNVSTSTINISVVKSDDQAPTITSFGTSSSTVLLKTSSQSQTITLTAVMSDNRSISSYSVTGATYTSQSGSTYSFTRTFSYGDYSFGSTDETITLSVTDAAGNSSSQSLVVEVTKQDDADPVISSFSVSPSSVNLLTSSQTATVTYTAEATDNRAISSYTLPGATFSSVSGSTYTWTRTFSYADFSYGSSSVSSTLTMSDAAGNSATDSVSVTVTKSDDQDPSITSFTTSSSSVALTTTDQSSTLTFTVVASDNVSVSSVAVTGSTLSSQSGSSYVFTRTYSYADYSFGSTTQTVTATVTDTAGNSTTSNVSITVTKTDNQAPSITSFTASESSVTLLSTSQVQAVTFTAVVSDNVAVSSATLAGATAVTTTGSTRTWNKSFAYANYSYGTTVDTYTVVVSDAAGNTSTQSVSITVVKSDDYAPTITSFNADASTVSLTTGGPAQLVTFTAVASDNRAIDSINLPTATYQGVSGSTYTWTKSYSYDDYAFGTTNDNLTLTVLDAAGNSATSSVSITVTKTDTQSPTIASFSSDVSSVELSSGQSSTVTFTAVASDNVGVDEYALSDGTQALTNPSVSGDTYTWTATLAADDFAEGSTTQTYTVEFSDGAGNTQTETVSFSVTVFNYTTMTTSTLHYIALTANINEAVTTDPGGTYYGLVGGAFDNGRAVEFNASYNLPTGSVTFPMGNVDAILPNSTTGGSFIPMITITANLEGNLSATVQMTGGPVTATVSENIDKAQVVAWETHATPTVHSTTQDVLSADVTSTDVYNHLSGAIQAVQDTYSHNVLSSWNMEITPIEARSTSILTQYAINNGRTAANLFMEGEQIVLDTTYPYSVQVTDLDGNQQTIVANTDIYALVTHSDAAPPLL